MARSMPEAPKTWIPTGSPPSVDATRFRPIGMLPEPRPDAAALSDRLRAAAGARA
jgi:hypothetical protein